MLNLPSSRCFKNGPSCFSMYCVQRSCIGTKSAYFSDFVGKLNNPKLENSVRVIRFDFFFGVGFCLVFLLGGWILVPVSTVLCHRFSDTSGRFFGSTKLVTKSTNSSNFSTIWFAAIVTKKLLVHLFGFWVAVSEMAINNTHMIQAFHHLTETYLFSPFFWYLVSECRFVLISNIQFNTHVLLIQAPHWHVNAIGVKLAHEFRIWFVCLIKGSLAFCPSPKDRQIFHKKSSCQIRLNSRI